LSGDGRALYRAVVDADLEGIVAKRPDDAYRPNHTR
jgi:ATP-dependent DNA ligase